MSLNKSDSMHDTAEARVFRTQLEKIINASPIKVSRKKKKAKLVEKEIIVEDVEIVGESNIDMFFTEVDNG